ncbi:MAG: hypothetical protein AAF631_02040 [Pseudomonadota bacterium]
MRIDFPGIGFSARHAGDWADVTVFFKGAEYDLIERVTCRQTASDTLSCAVDCNGGSFTARWRGEDTILMTTRGFSIRRNCDRTVSRIVRDRGAASTSYRLNPAAPDACPRIAD